MRKPNLKAMSILSKLHRLLLNAENLLLVAVLLSMIGVAVAQIVMRNFFHSGLLWADAYTRVSVLWIALLGSMIASRERKHIAIDVLLQRLPKHWKKPALRFSQLLTALVCYAVAWFSAGFVIQEYSFGDRAFADVPNWWCQTIIPFAFTLMALRYSCAVFLTGHNR